MSDCVWPASGLPVSFAVLESDHRTSDRLVTRLLYRWDVRPALLCPFCRTRGKWRSSYQCLRSSLTEMETKWRVGPQDSWGAPGPPSTHPVLQTAFPRIWWWDRPLKRSRDMLTWHNLTRENWKKSNNFLLQVLDICTNMKKTNLTAQLDFRLMWSRCYFSYFLLLPPTPWAPGFQVGKPFSLPDLFSTYDQIFALLLSLLSIITRIVYSIYSGKWNIPEEMAGLSVLALKYQSLPNLLFIILPIILIFKLYIWDYTLFIIFIILYCLLSP